MSGPGFYKHRTFHCSTINSPLPHHKGRNSPEVEKIFSHSGFTQEPVQPKCGMMNYLAFPVLCHLAGRKMGKNRWVIESTRGLHLSHKSAASQTTAHISSLSCLFPSYLYPVNMFTPWDFIIVIALLLKADSWLEKEERDTGKNKRNAARKKGKGGRLHGKSTFGEGGT